MQTTMLPRHEALFQADADLSAEYNHTLAHGKWDHMMDQTHIGYTGWHDPPTNVMPEVVDTANPDRAGIGIAVEGSLLSWSARREGASLLPAFDVFNQQRHYIDIFNRGRTAFEFTAQTTQPWIKLSATHGKIEKDERLWVSIDWSKAPKGNATGTVTLAGADAAINLTVNAVNPNQPTRDSLKGFVEADGYVSIEAAHYTRKINTASAWWEEIGDYGRTSSSMTIFPVTSLGMTGSKDSPCLEYQMYLFTAGSVKVETILAPTLNFVPGRGLRYEIAFDDQRQQIIDALANNSVADWGTAVKDSVRKVQSEHTLVKPGYHTLKIWAVDPGVVLQKIVVDTGGVKPSYQGPPESYHNPPANARN